MSTFVWIVHDRIMDQYTWGIHSSLEKAIQAIKTTYDYGVAGTWRELQKESESNFVLIKDFDEDGQQKKWNITRYELDE